jgi:hypothetical protein
VPNILAAAVLAVLLPVPALAIGNTELLPSEFAFCVRSTPAVKLINPNTATAKTVPIFLKLINFIFHL